MLNGWFKKQAGAIKKPRLHNSVVSHANRKMIKRTRAEPKAISLWARVRLFFILREKRYKSGQYQQNHSKARISPPSRPT
jgi:hypothetical protein